MKRTINAPGLRDLHKTIDDATEVVAAFISTARSKETPHPSLMEAAEKVVGDLAEWRAALKEALDAPELADVDEHDVQ